VSDEIARRRETRRRLAEAVRVHVEDPDRALAVLQSVPSPLSRDGRTAPFLDLVAERAVFQAQSRIRIDPRGAIEMLRRIPRAAGCYGGAQLLIGQTSIHLDLPRDAEAAYLEARAVAPQSYDAVFGLARTLQILQKYEDAIRAWQDAAALQPDSSAPHVQRAVCLRRLNRVEEARAAFRKALEVDPRDARAAELLKDLDNPNRSR
jgi:tetratricopeptide (TPR) repeat protein